MARNLIGKKTVSVELGKKYRDTITGFEGVATSRTEFLYGCFRVTLSGVLNGEPKDFNFDEPQLEAIPTEKPIKPRQHTGSARPSSPRTGL